MSRAAGCTKGVQMGSDQRIRADKVVARCCYGVCFGFGFVVTTLSLAAMFWIFWCYFGLSIIHFTDTQRRAVVDYSFTTPKIKVGSSTASPIRNTPSDIPETSLNQISRFATASSGSHRLESSTTVEKRKESSRSSESNLAKGDFAARERTNKTTTNGSSLQLSKNGTQGQVTLKDNVNKERSTSLNTKVTNSRGVSSILPSRPITEENIKIISRNESQSDPKKLSDPTNAGNPYNAPRNADGIEKANISTDIEADLVRTMISNPRRPVEVNYSDPKFEESRTQRTSDEEIRRGYNDKDIPRRDRDQNSDRYSKGDGRVLPKDDPGPSVRSSSTSTERRYRDRIPEDDRYYDRYPPERRRDKYDVDYYEDREPDDRRFVDRYSGVGRKREDDRVANDRYKYEKPKDIRYADERTIRGDGGRYRGEEPVRDSKKLDRIPDVDEYVSRNPEDSRRVRTEDRLSRDDYKDREPGDTRRYSEGRIKEDRERYDSRPINRDRYAERRPDDYRYTDRYPDESIRKINGDRYDDSAVREDRYRGRIPKDDGYTDRYSDKERRGGNRRQYDDISVKTDDEYDRRGDDRYLDAGRRRNNEDRYRDRSYDERTRYRDDRIPYRETRVDERDKISRNRNSDEGSYRSRDRVDVRDSRTQTSSTRYDDKDKDDRYRVRIDDDRFRDEIYKSDEHSLMSSRREERFEPERTRSSRPNYAPRETFREPEYIPSKEYSSTYIRTDVPRPIRETTTEDRYRSISRNNRPSIPPRFEEEDRISPSRVRDDTYISHKDETYTSRSRSDDRRKEDRNERSDVSVSNTKYSDESNRRIASTATVGSRIGNSETHSESRRGHYPINEEERKEFNKEVSLDRRSYSSEEDDEYSDRNPRPRYSAESRNRDRTYEERRRDYRYENPRSEYDEETDEYKERKRSYYNIPSSYSVDTYPREQVSRYDGIRDSRYDDRNSRNHDLTDEDRNRHDRNRGDYDRHPTNKNHYGIVDNYGKDRDSYDSDIHSSRSYNRPVANDDRIRSSYPDKTYLSEDTKGGLPENQRTRYILEEKDRSLMASTDTTLNPKRYQRHSSDLPLMKSVSPSRTRDSVVVSSVSRFGDSLPLDVIVKNNEDQVKSREQDEEQPLSAKDVIEAALRHSETHEQSERKVFYPVFDPRISNLTSPDIIRPSERRGTTITAKKKR